MLVNLVPGRIASALAIGALALFASACESTTTLVTSPDPGGISVNGVGTVTVTPDIALLNMGVEVRAPSVAAARKGAAEAADALRASLKRNGIEDRDIKTQGLSIQPEYASRATSQPTIIGYIVSNQVTVKVRNLDNASKTLDDAVLAGGNSVRVNGISFAVDDPEKYSSQARALAVKDAKARAEELAKQAGVSLGKPRTITESFGGPGPVPAFTRGAGDLAEAPTPISPGESEVTINVSILYAVQ